MMTINNSKSMLITLMKQLHWKVVGGVAGEPGGGGTLPLCKSVAVRLAWQLYGRQCQLNCVQLFNHRHGKSVAYSMNLPSPPTNHLFHLLWLRAKSTTDSLMNSFQSSVTKPDFSFFFISFLNVKNHCCNWNCSCCSYKAHCNRLS